MAIAKVILNDETLMDVTQKTVDSANMLSGVTALKNDGTSVTGSIVSKSSSDVNISGTTVSVPAGYYGSNVNKDINSITINIPSSGTKTLSVTVPNGSITATFVFNVDTSGNVTITET